MNSCPRQSRLDFWWKKLQWDKFLSRSFLFPPVNIVPLLFHIHSRAICDTDRRTVRRPHLQRHSIIPQQEQQPKVILHFSSATTTKYFLAQYYLVLLHNASFLRHRFPKSSVMYRRYFVIVMGCVLGCRLV